MTKDDFFNEQIRLKHASDDQLREAIAYYRMKIMQKEYLFVMTNKNPSKRYVDCAHEMMLIAIAQSSLSSGKC